VYAKAKKDVLFASKPMNIKQRNRLRKQRQIMSKETLEDHVMKKLGDEYGDLMAWQSLIAAIAEKVKCLPSVFPDDNLHILTAIDKILARTPDKELIEALEKIKEQEYIIGQFGEWYSDNGCPVTETKEGFCPDIDGYRAEHEKQNLKEAEEDRFDFDSSDCETQINCGKCYAEYYRMKYKESTNDH
jgi:hypothetical protein